ncbi:morphogenic membrane protein MmpB [Streptomyces sp. NPDC054796]
MLWSDPRDEPPEELRTAQAMLRRLTWLLPVAVVIVLLLSSVR